MNLVTILDTETTGLDAASSCIEVAVILFDVKNAAPVSSYASLMFAEQNPAEHVNHISIDLLKLAPKPEDVWPAVASFIDQSDAILAHNAPFDMKFIPDTIKKEVPWICTMNDIGWPKGKRGERLTSLALDHGVGVVHAHRAMSDIDIICRLLGRVSELGVSIEALLMDAMRPKKRFVASVSFEDRDKARAHGFLWESSRKEWWRKMPPEDTKNLPFTVRQVDV